MVCTLVALGARAQVPAAPRPPLGLPTLPGAAPDLALVAVGKTFFFDQRLSRDGQRSCATCHDPAHLLTDGRATAEGAARRTLTRNTPSLYNVVYVAALFWDGRVSDLVEQARFPLQSPLEHGLASDAELVSMVRRDPAQLAALAAALHGPAGAVTGVDVRRALAAYEQSLVAGDSAADRYLFGGEQTALSPAAVRGLELFRGRAGCANCHTMGATSALYTDGLFHPGPQALPSTTLAKLPELTRRVETLVAQQRLSTLSDWIDTDTDVAALGHYLATLNPADIGSFRTPSLRNVAQTAPYFHDGRVTTLREAVDAELYSRADARYPIVLTSDERRDLVEFLEALSTPY